MVCWTNIFRIYTFIYAYVYKYENFISREFIGISTLMQTYKRKPFSALHTAKFAGCFSIQFELLLQHFCIRYIPTTNKLPTNQVLMVLAGRENNSILKLLSLKLNQAAIIEKGLSSPVLCVFVRKWTKCRFCAGVFLCLLLVIII